MLGGIFDEFYRPELRNAISHSDFVFGDDELRSRRGYGIDISTWSFAELDDLITKAKVFVGTFFALERDARQFWGVQGKMGIRYDPVFKGILEILVDDRNLMNGFKVHWPNGSDSLYRRTADGIDMVNCMLDLQHTTLQMFVGQYARKHGSFSPLVEADGSPSYSRLEGSDTELTWDGIGS